MKIGLLDVDGHNFPNLALMKLSDYHKKHGDHIEFLNTLCKYDRVYMSKVFTFTPDEDTCIQANEIIKGGTGYDLQNKLAPEVESQYPDYSLYGIKNEAYGYLTRGCPRGCPFCIVGEKEGLKSYKVANLDQFWNGQKSIKLLDPNITACKDKIELLQQLIDSKAWVDFTQGLDIRLMTDEVAELLSKIKIKMIHFAWDMEKDSELILKNLTEFRRTSKMSFDRLRVYVLTNYNTTHEFDLERVYKLREMGYDPYVMIYGKESTQSTDTVRRVQRWVNSKRIFRKCEKFEDYGGAK